MDSTVDGDSSSANKGADSRGSQNAFADESVELAPMPRWPEGEDVDAVVQGGGDGLAQRTAIFHIVAG